MTPLGKLKVYLREVTVPGLKDGTDYVILHKYTELHVLCHAVFEESIREAFEKNSMFIYSLTTVDTR